MLKIFKKENSSTYVFTKSMGYVNRTINNIYHIIIINLSAVLFSQKQRKKVYIIEHETKMS
jgi:hypothetical protein